MKQSATISRDHYEPRKHQFLHVCLPFNAQDSHPHFYGHNHYTLSTIPATSVSMAVGEMPALENL